MARRSLLQTAQQKEAIMDKIGRDKEPQIEGEIKTLGKKEKKPIDTELTSGSEKGTVSQRQREEERK